MMKMRPPGAVDLLPSVAGHGVDFAVFASLARDFSFLFALWNPNGLFFRGGYIIA